MEASTPILPTHISDTIRLIVQLRAEHHQAATRLRRFVDRLTALVGQPRFIDAATCVTMLWLGGIAVDPRRFPGSTASSASSRFISPC